MTNKKELSERDICTKFINPALEQAGRDMQKQVHEEVSFTDGYMWKVTGQFVANANGRITFSIESMGSDSIDLDNF